MITLTTLEIPGVHVLEPDVFSDSRGSYSESYSYRTLSENYGIATVFVQDNHSVSTRKGTLRGIHFQNNPKPQGKLVRCTRGRVLDVVVDLRRDSPTFARWLTIELSDTNHLQIWIPRGFGHAFVTLEDNSEVQYKVDEYYYPQHDRAVRWNDPELGIEWGIDNPILSQRDTVAPLWEESDCNFNMKDNSG